MDLEKLKTDQTLLSQVAADEGIKATPYRDTRGNWTGGIGHNLERPRRSVVEDCDMAKDRNP